MVIVIFPKIVIILYQGVIGNLYGLTILCILYLPNISLGCFFFFSLLMYVEAICIQFGKY